jgi:hypothetical protein
MQTNTLTRRKKESKIYIKNIRKNSSRIRILKNHSGSKTLLPNTSEKQIFAIIHTYYCGCPLAKVSSEKPVPLEKKICATGYFTVH